MTHILLLLSYELLTGAPGREVPLWFNLGALEASPDGSLDPAKTLLCAKQKELEKEGRQVRTLKILEFTITSPEGICEGVLLWRRERLLQPGRRLGRVVWRREALRPARRYAKPLQSAKPQRQVQEGRELWRGWEKHTPLGRYRVIALSGGLVYYSLLRPQPYSQDEILLKTNFEGFFAEIQRAEQQAPLGTGDAYTEAELSAIRDLKRLHPSDEEQETIMKKTEKIDGHGNAGQPKDNLVEMPSPKNTSAWPAELAARVHEEAQQLSGIAAQLSDDDPGQKREKTWLTELIQDLMNLTPAPEGAVPASVAAEPVPPAAAAPAPVNGNGHRPNFLRRGWDAVKENTGAAYDATKELAQSPKVHKAGHYAWKGLQVAAVVAIGALVGKQGPKYYRQYRGA